MAPEASERVYNDHNVYILGAGFSFDAAGMPLVDDFMRTMAEAPEWLGKRTGRQDEIDAIVAVLDFRRRAASAAYRVNLRLENVEELFSFASVSEGDIFADKVVKAISATLDYAQHEAKPGLYRILPGRWQPPQAWQRLPEPTEVYHRSANEVYVALMTGAGGMNRRAPERRDTIITFNYDLVVEQALEALEVKYSYGFDKDDAEFHSSWGVPESAAVEVPRVLKLHGSVNWARPNAEHNKIGVYRDYEGVRKSGSTPALVPPTWRKNVGSSSNTRTEQCNSYNNCWVFGARDRRTLQILIGRRSSKQHLAAQDSLC